jgi:hypothetical protein
VETLNGIKFITWTYLGDFCKKIPQNRPIYVFLCPHFGVYVFFFKYKGMPRDTSFERPHPKEYNALHICFLNIFKAYMPKK